MNYRSLLNVVHHPLTRRTRRVIRAIVVTLACAAAVAFVTSITVDLGPALRVRAETAGSNYLKRPMHIGRLAVHLWRGTFVVENLTIDGATKNFTVRKVGATPEPGKSFELWLISDKLPRPRSLGVIGASDFTARQLLASYDSEVVNGATYAVTVEQAGGSPDGRPTSSPVFSGKLIETVPPPQPQAPAKK